MTRRRTKLVLRSCSRRGSHLAAPTLRNHARVPIDSRGAFRRGQAARFLRGSSDARAADPGTIAPCSLAQQTGPFVRRAPTSRANFVLSAFNENQVRPGATHGQEDERADGLAEQANVERALLRVGSEVMTLRLVVVMVVLVLIALVLIAALARVLAARRALDLVDRPLAPGAERVRHRRRPTRPPCAHHPRDDARLRAESL